MYFLPPIYGLSCPGKGFVSRLHLATCPGKGFVSRLHLAVSWFWTPLHICSLWHISRLQQSFWVHCFLVLQTISLPGGLWSPATWAFFLFFLSHRYIPANSLLTPPHTHTHFRPTCLLMYWYLRSTHVLKPYLQPASIALCLACQSALLLVQLPLFNKSVLEFSHFYSLLLLRVGFTYWNPRAKFNPTVQSKACINMIHKYSIWVLCWPLLACV